MNHKATEDRMSVSTVEAPQDFGAVVLTAPACVDMDALKELMSGTDKLLNEIEKLVGHRIVHARQVQEADSATVALLLDMAKRARAHGYEFVICDPPRVLDSFLDIYLPGPERAKHTFYTDRDDPAGSPVPWIPPFLKTPYGRIDIWQQGHWSSSYRWSITGLHRDK
jgi:ABC-type transporter Mla MlaB component